MASALNQNRNEDFVRLADTALKGRSLKHQALDLALAGRSPVGEIIRVASELGD